jgi:hypothetical protein
MFKNNRKIGMFIGLLNMDHLKLIEKRARKEKVSKAKALRIILDEYIKLVELKLNPQ